MSFEFRSKHLGLSILVGVLLLGNKKVLAQDNDPFQTFESDPSISAPLPRANEVTSPTSSKVSSENEGEKVILIPHPNAAKGLESISKDKVYQYRVKPRSKSQSTTVTLNVASAWSFTNSVDGNAVKYSSIYPASTYLSASGTYEYMLTQAYGGFILAGEFGIGSAQGHGVFADGVTQAKESYSLYMVPISALVKYRFEYRRHQLLVPYLEGGLTYVAMAEIRNDGSSPTRAGSEAVGAGGGLLINISGRSAQSSFVLDQEYGLSDMWLSLGARQWIGLKQSLDLTNTVVMAGVAVDY
jgi:hypothetical protein